MNLGNTKSKWSCCTGRTPLPLSTHHTRGHFEEYQYLWLTDFRGFRLTIVTAVLNSFSTRLDCVRYPKFLRAPWNPRREIVVNIDEGPQPLTWSKTLGPRDEPTWGFSGHAEIHKLFNTKIWDKRNESVGGCCVFGCFIVTEVEAARLSDWRGYQSRVSPPFFYLDLLILLNQMQLMRYLLTFSYNHIIYIRLWKIRCLPEPFLSCFTASEQNSPNGLDMYWNIFEKKRGVSNGALCSHKIQIQALLKQSTKQSNG